jgi:uncharacterized membrane protein YqhA
MLEIKEFEPRHGWIKENKIRKFKQKLLEIAIIVSACLILLFAFAFVDYIENYLGVH